MSIQQNLARCFKNLQKLENITVSLIEDHIDKWEVNYKYPNNKEVTLRFDFHLKELLPPKITVVFPASIQYVCFQELGSIEWKKNNNDIPTLIYSLQTEFNYRAQTRAEGRVQTPQEAQSQWKFVQGAHTDWGYVDVVELSNKLENGELNTLRSEGSKALIEELDGELPPSVPENNQQNKPVAVNKIPPPPPPPPVRGQYKKLPVLPVNQKDAAFDDDPVFDFILFSDDLEKKEQAVIEDDDPVFDFILFSDDQEKKEQDVLPEKQKQVLPAVPKEEEEPFEFLLFGDDQEQNVLPENQKQVLPENQKQVLPDVVEVDPFDFIFFDEVQEKKEILKKEVPVQENNQDLQENKEEIITN